MNALRYKGHGDFLPYMINRVTAFLNFEFQKVLEGYELTLTHWRVLAFLAEQDGLSISALAEATGTEQSTLSRALSHLEGRGLIRRQPSREDNRSVTIILQAQGKAVFDAILVQALQIESRVLGKLSDDELDTLRALLGKIMVLNHLPRRLSRRASEPT